MHQRQHPQPALLTTTNRMVERSDILIIIASPYRKLPMTVLRPTPHAGSLLPLRAAAQKFWPLNHTRRTMMCKCNVANLQRFLARSIAL
jgi:hypothetical protein